MTSAAKPLKVLAGTGGTDLWLDGTEIDTKVCVRIHLHKLHCLNCTKFGQLILRIINIVATRCNIFTLKCTKFDFGWGIAPPPPGAL